MDDLTPRSPLLSPIRLHSVPPRVRDRGGGVKRTANCVAMQRSDAGIGDDEERWTEAFGGEKFREAHEEAMSYERRALTQFKARDALGGAELRDDFLGHRLDGAAIGAHLHGKRAIEALAFFEQRIEAGRGVASEQKAGVAAVQTCEQGFGRGREAEEDAPPFDNGAAAPV